MKAIQRAIPLDVPVDFGWRDVPSKTDGVLVMVCGLCGGNKKHCSACGGTVLPPPQQRGDGIVDQPVRLPKPSPKSVTGVRSASSRRKLKTLAERRGWVCCYCGCELNEFSATADHIIPAADGGRNGVDNNDLACAPCNQERGRFPRDLYIIWRIRRGLPVRAGALEEFQMTPPFTVADLASLRPQNRTAINLIILTLPDAAQRSLRAEARDAVYRHGDDAEVTVYNGFRYRLPARYVHHALNDRRRRPLHASGDLWTTAFAMMRAWEADRDAEVQRQIESMAEEARRLAQSPLAALLS